VELPASPQGRAASRPHVAALDGLRALAIGLVMLHHLTPGHDSNQGIKSAVFKIADLGWSGVDLFFVLSGFLITDILLKAREARLPMRDFLVRRVLRIAPLYYAALVLMFVLAPAIGLYAPPDPSVQAAYWLYVANFLPNGLGAGPLGGVFHLNHFWSLAVEMQFYLLWPCAVYFLPRRKVMVLCVALLALNVLARAATLPGDAPWMVLFGWTPFRMTGLLVGCAIAAARADGIPPAWQRAIAEPLVVAGLAIAAASAWFGWATVVYHAGDSAREQVVRALLPPAMSLLYGGLLVLALQPSLLSRVLSHPVFTRVATYSYGAYIFQMLVPWMERAWGPRVLQSAVPGTDLPIYTYFILSSAVVFALAALSYHCFESRFLRMQPRHVLRAA
jgi:peptidoglycan/LPS O-acetylase OafA/YrhL